MQFIVTNFWKGQESHPVKGNAIRTLNEIYNFLHRDKNSLVFFTANVVFGTSGFLCLQNGNERWASRGILQITGERSYRKLAIVTGDDHFLKCPQELAILKKSAVRASILFWKALLCENFGKNLQGMTFWKTLVLLNPSEVRNPYDRCGVLRIRNRYEIYYALCKILNIAPDNSSPLS